MIDRHRKLHKAHNGYNDADEVYSLFSVFDSIERYAPGFKDSVVGRDVLSPPDLESIFGLTGGVSAIYYSQ